jgi:hypothetical protein
MTTLRSAFRALAPALLGSALLLAAGCATSSAKLNKITTGMAKDEVVATLGKPHAVTAAGDTEYLTYNLLNKGVGDMKEFAVKLVGGRVESYGEKADFGPNLLQSTNAPVR